MSSPAAVGSGTITALLCTNVSVPEHLAHPPRVESNPSVRAMNLFPALLQIQRRLAYRRKQLTMSSAPRILIAAVLTAVALLPGYQAVAAPLTIAQLLNIRHPSD